MRYDQHLVAGAWDGYELLDSGENTRLERFGSVVLVRPETQALWKKGRPELWKTAAAIFTPGEKGGTWNVQESLPEPWHIPAWKLTLVARLTSFKHVGIFPEQAPNWGWVRERVEMLSRSGIFRPRILNLFGYTGAATLAAAVVGAAATHVDASKQSLDWAQENARLSGVTGDAIRWIVDDALAFAKREVRRGATYDGVILDPPAFGRGAKGEVWHIERDLPVLLIALKELLAEKPGSFFLLNGYAAGYASRSLAQAVESAFGTLESGESGELQIKGNDSERVMPSGIYVRFVR